MTALTGYRRVRTLAIVAVLVLSGCTAPSEPMANRHTAGGSRMDDPASTTTPANSTFVPKEDAATSSTTAATPVTPSSNPAAGVPAAPTHEHIAVIGCSQTRDAIKGFNDVTDEPIFGPDEDQEYLSAGTIDQWAANGGHWRRFAALHRDDTEIGAVWIMLCWHVRNTDPSTSVETVASIIDRAETVIGHEVAVFVSGLNDWEPRTICAKADWASSWALADDAVAAGLADRGPELGPLTETQTTDGCHGTTEGNAVMGTQVASFFLGT